jgi:hypothetical protein
VVVKSINKSLLKKFIELAGKKLTGRWVLIGGTVLPLLDSEIRPTIDSDMIGLPIDSNRESLLLMQIAEELGLPVETINQAGAYFLSKQENFENSLVILHEGKNAKIYRPDVNLFIRLKIDRMTETDLEDCLEFIRIAESTKERLDRAQLVRKISTLIKNSKSNDKTKRLKIILETIQRSSN